MLIATPTGSGKTLAAFLAAIDELVREGEQWGLPDETRVLYVSPLKALSNDINRNLEAPLDEVAVLLDRLAPLLDRPPDESLALFVRQLAAFLDPVVLKRGEKEPQGGNPALFAGLERLFEIALDRAAHSGRLPPAAAIPDLRPRYSLSG